MTRAAATAPRALLGPRERPRRPADLASRAPLIAHQRRSIARTRRLRRALRAAGRVVGAAFVVAAGAVVVVVAADWIRRTPLLAVHAVEVEGVHRLDPETVRSAAGVAAGVNLLGFDVRAAEARVAALPGVRRAHVVRQLPGRVTVVVDEREPYALVNADRLYWVDAEGYLVGADARPGVIGLPILTGIEAPPAAGAPPSERLQSGLLLLQTMQRTAGRLAGRVSEVDLARADGPALYLVDGVEARLGQDGWPDRLARLDGVLADLDARGERVTSIDLRFRDLVVLTPRTAAPGPAGGTRATGRRAPGVPSAHAPAAAAGLERR